MCRCTIDRGTAGLVLFSARRDSRSQYQALFRTGRVRKLYEAIAAPVPKLLLPHTHQSRIVRGTPFFRMCEEQGEANAVTIVESVAWLDAAHGAQRARYLLRPVTGRKHQLRVHMAALGAAIENDPLYPEMDATNLPGVRLAGDWSAPSEETQSSASASGPRTRRGPVERRAWHFESTLRLE